MQKILIGLLTALLILVPLGCSTTGEGGGIVSIEEMSGAQFEIVTTIVRLGTKLGVGQLLSSGTIEGEGREILEAVAVTLREVAEEPASESVSTLLSESLGRVEALQNYANRSTILTAIEFAENYIIERGGFGVVETASGEFLLSDRTKALILAVAKGIEEALEANPAPTTLQPDSAGENLRSAFTIEGIMTDAFIRAELTGNRVLSERE